MVNALRRTRYTRRQAMLERTDRLANLRGAFAISPKARERNLLIAARAMQAGVSILRPHLIAADIKPKGKIVLGTVKGDLHDIGKNIVGMMFEGAGFELIDLGVDAAPEKFIAAVREHQPDFLCMSALLTTTMANMIQTIQALKEAGLRSEVKVMVGGAPISKNFADEIGADLFATNAAAAANMASEAIAA